MLNNIADQLHDVDHRLSRLERRLSEVEESNLALLSGIQQLKATCQQILAAVSSGLTQEELAAVVAKIRDATAALNRVS